MNYSEKKITKQAFKVFESALNPNEYIATKLNHSFITATSTLSLNYKIKNILNKTKINFHYIIWTNRNKKIFTNLQKYDNNYEKACQIIFECQVNRKYKGGIECPESEVENLHNTFGPHFLVANITSCSEYKNELIKPDLADHYPYLWIKSSKKFTLVVMINPSELSKLRILSNTIKNLEKENKLVSYAAKIDKQIIATTNDIKSFIQNFQRTAITENKVIEYNNYSVIHNYIGGKTDVFAFITNNKHANKMRFIKVLCASTIITLLLLYYFYRNFVSEYSRTFKANIIPKLTIFFILFNLIPTTMFILYSHSYLSEYKRKEIVKLYNEGLDYLQQIDNLYISERTFQVSHLKKGINKLKQRLKTEQINHANITEFLRWQSPKVLRLSLVGSTTKVIATEGGIFEGDKKIANIDGYNGISSIEGFSEMGKIMVMMGKLFLAKLNKQPIPANEAIKLDFIASSLGQTTTLAMIQKFYEHNGKIANLGIGTAHSPVFTYAFSVFGKKSFDYVLSYSNFDWELLGHYLTRMLFSIERNVYGLNISFFSGKGFQIPKSLKVSSDLIKYRLALLNNLEPTMPVKGMWQNKQYYFVGLRGQRLKNLILVSMYPCDLISKKIATRRHELITFIVLSFLISILFGLSWSRSILLPLNDLKTGINALKHHNFKHRVPDLGKNEFGEISNIINETMEDMQELQKTNDFNLKIFANVGKEISQNKALIFGNASVFNENGKDYLDIFEIPETSKIGILWGRIDKVGVAATLLGAFVKSCTMINSEHQGTPQVFGEEINKIVAKINNKEKSNIITFSYQTFDTTTLEIEIVNFGCDAPLLIDCENKTVTKCENNRLTLKQSSYLVYSSTSLAQNAKFKNCLLDSANSELAEFYKNVFEKLPTIDSESNSMVILSSSIA